MYTLTPPLFVASEPQLIEAKFVAKTVKFRNLACAPLPLKCNGICVITKARNLSVLVIIYLESASLVESAPGPAVVSEKQ